MSGQGSTGEPRRCPAPGASLTESTLLMRRFTMHIAAAAIVALTAGAAQATDFTIGLAGSASAFGEGQTDFDNLHFDQFSQYLTGLDSSNAITVAQGDVIHATVTFDSAYTIPDSIVRTDILLNFLGSDFPSEDTGVTGTFNFFNAGALVRTFGYSSTTSGFLANFAAVFPPANGAFTFDSFTDDFTINALATPATLDGASFNYSLVSPLAAVPEPAAWTTLVAGFGMIGVTMRRRRDVGLSRC